MPRVITLRVVFPPGVAEKTEPIITTGEFSNGDFLAIRYVDAGHATLKYDAWGAGGPESVPFELNPGTERQIRVELPSLAELPGVSTREKARLDVALDGHEILSGDVTFHRRKAEQIYFGSDPIGGSTESVFRGKVFAPSGRELFGQPTDYFSLRARLLWYFTQASQVIGTALFALALGFLFPACARFLRSQSQDPAVPPNNRPPHRWFLAITTLAVLLFTFAITDGTFKLVYPESFGSFYDYQAVSLLHGRLDVPGEALSGEAFIYQGKCYGYFGPTPALLRMPLALSGIAFGDLSRLFMVLEYIFCLWAVYRLLCHAVRTTRGAAAWPSRWATVVFVGAAALGSTLFFLGSRAYIYHEAILCGAACGLWSTYYSLRFVDAPKHRWWLGALIFGVLSVHARPPIGLYALALLGVCAAVNLYREVRKHHSRLAAPRTPNVHWVRYFSIAALAVLGVLSFNGLSYLKFHTIEGCPLRYNVQYNPKRLAHIDGKQFHLSNIEFGIDAYLLHPSLRFSRHFPFVGMKGVDPTLYRQAKLDLTEPMTGIPYAMPGLCLLAVLGGFCAFRTEVDRAQLAAIWLSVLPTALAMFAAIAVSHRYTGDFVPFLIAAAAFGAAFVDGISRPLRTVIRAGTTLAVLASIAVTFALTAGFEGEGVWGVPESTHQHYRTLQKTVDRFLGVSER